MTKRKYESLSSHYAGGFDAVRDALPEPSPGTTESKVDRLYRQLVEALEERNDAWAELEIWRVIAIVEAVSLVAIALWLRAL